jgi:hypothetical protein
MEIIFLSFFSFFSYFSVFLFSVLGVFFEILNRGDKIIKGKNIINSLSLFLVGGTR